MHETETEGKYTYDVRFNCPGGKDMTGETENNSLNELKNAQQKPGNN